MKVMVTIAVKRDIGPWRERTVTLAGPDETERELAAKWLAEFPGLLDRALKAVAMGVEDDYPRSAWDGEDAPEGDDAQA